MGVHLCYIYNRYTEEVYDIERKQFFSQDYTPSLYDASICHKEIDKYKEGVLSNCMVVSAYLAKAYMDLFPKYYKKKPKIES